MTIAAALSEDQVLALTRKTSQAAAEALTWISGNPDKVRKDGERLLRDFRRLGHAARKLEAALVRPMCVGVFGPSQAGKSYLISALARRPGARVRAVFAGRDLDFVSEINPEGGQESTGIVTRFTVKHQDTPAGFPVALRLLSQTDLVKILGNTYLSDFDLSAEDPATPERIHEVLTLLAGRTAGGPVDTLTEDGVFDLREYFERHFRGAAIIKSLGTRYWERAAQLAPRLGLDDRALLFGLIWNEVEPLSRIYRRLAGALQQIGFPEDAYCPIEALVPRAVSIIDVQTLKDLARPAGNRLEIVTRTGKRAQLERAEITALIAELTITLGDQPWPFFDHTDLLDFPGARSRENIPDPQGNLANPDKSPGFFLRGKVAYLFQRYCAEQELTSMLLCIGSSNQEVRTLPAMVKEWIDTTHGAEPQDRVHNKTALFLILTKFDAEFEEKSGQSHSSEARWTIRLNASLLDFFGKAHSWPQEWQPGQPFNNSFWLRNPNVKAKHILDYDADGREVALRRSESARIAAMRSEYCSNPLVRRHFADPERAWDEALRLNDGGVGYLAQALAPVCNPVIKQRQVEQRLGVVRRSMSERLAPFFVNTDLDAELAKRRATVKQIAVAVAESAEQQRFGKLLRLLHLDTAALLDLCLRIEDGLVGGGSPGGAEGKAEPGGRPTMPAMPIGARVSSRKLVSAMFDSPSEPAVGAPAGPEPAADHADLFAATAISEWSARLQAAAEDPARAAETGVPAALLGALATELIAGVARLDLRRTIAQAIRPSLNYRQKSVLIPQKAVMTARQAINGYVNHFGFADRPLDQRPRVHHLDRPVFPARPPIAAFPPLTEEPEAYETDLYYDWITGLRQLVDDNVRFRNGTTLDEVANGKLGTILALLTPTPTA